LIGIWRFRPFVMIVGLCAAPFRGRDAEEDMTASPSDSANATASRTEVLNEAAGALLPTR